jgi:hypothetical protein
MKPIGKFNSSFKPKIVFDYLALEKAKYLVSKMDKEIQWFHRMDVSEDRSIYYVYDLIIPQQEVSLTEANSDSSMMLNLYRDLVKERGAEETNATLSNMVVWCHSHHTMAPNPSGQDNKQFEEFDTTLPEGYPRLMLIFNKAHQYYSKVKDPFNGFVFENIDIHVSSPFDTKEIDTQIKAKVKDKKLSPLFKKPKKIQSKSFPTFHIDETKDFSFKGYTKSVLGVTYSLLTEDYEDVYNSWNGNRSNFYINEKKSFFENELLDLIDFYNMSNKDMKKILEFTKELLEFTDPIMFQEAVDFYMNTLSHKLNLR